ncbi:unnamed protein product [Linum tenue]|uniref:Uncharacterized protein n=1 Tax=Linum tenue TaxID=586396 RepID=A0AAV0N4N3_9ROSI|nr:unnamed protein product [Linum tenue]
MEDGKPESGEFSATSIFTSALTALRRRQLGLTT